MDLLQFRIYASVEIKKDVLIFCVTKIINGRMLIVFKREQSNVNHWLNDQDEVIDINGASLVLNNYLKEFETLYPTFKIAKISLILPSGQLKIQEIYKEMTFDSQPVGGESSKTQQLKDAIKREATDSEFIVIDIKPISWIADGQKISMAQVRQSAAGKIGLTAMVYQLPMKVFASHDQVIRVTECSTMLVTFNINELYSLIKSHQPTNKSVLVINWNAQNLEVGYFENGVLKNFKLIKGGMNLVIHNFAKKLRLKLEHAQNYIFNLIDFNSPNNLDSVIYQRWDNQQKILNQYHTNEIQQILTNELGELYHQALNVACYADTKQPTENYHFGVIQQIAGSEKLLASIQQWPWEHVFHAFILGLGMHDEYNAIVGVNKTLEKINNAQPNTIYTSLGSFNAQPSKKAPDNNYAPFKPSVSGVESPLYFKRENMLVDYQSSSKLKKN